MPMMNEAEQGTSMSLWAAPDSNPPAATGSQPLADLLRLLAESPTAITLRPPVSRRRPAGPTADRAHQTAGQDGEPEDDEAFYLETLEEPAELAGWLAEDPSPVEAEPRLVELPDPGSASNLIQLYLQEIGRYPLLTAEQETWLAVRISGPRALEELAAAAAGQTNGDEDLDEVMTTTLLAALLADWVETVQACRSMAAPPPDIGRLFDEAFKLRTVELMDGPSYLRHYLLNGEWGRIDGWSDLSVNLFATFTDLYLLPPWLLARLAEHINHPGLPPGLNAGGSREPRPLPKLPAVDWTDNTSQLLELAATAQLQMINANLRLVVSIARLYRDKGLPFMDLIQEGNRGLMRVVTKFNPSLGNRFSTYATWWIQEGVRRSLISQGRLIPVPPHIAEEIGKIRRLQRELTQQLGREPTIEDLALASDYLSPEERAAIGRAGPDRAILEPLLRQKWQLAVGRIQDVLGYARDAAYIDEPLGPDGDTERIDLLPDEDAEDPDASVAQIQRRQRVFEVLGTLEARERDILVRRYGLEDGRYQTLDEVGRHLGVTRERVRQIEVTALRKMRHPSRAFLLRDD